VTSGFEGDVAVVTGGTRGIGRAVAERLAAAGATTVATYHADEAAAGETRTALATYDAETGVERFDVADADAVEEAFDRVGERFGPPTVLVNNAGIMRNSLLIRMSPEEWSSVIETNLTGTFNCTRVAARAMLRGEGGRIVNVSSVAARRGWAGQSNYAASKAGIVGFTRSVARELGGKGIRVNAVCPGYADTDLYDDLAGDLEGDPADATPQSRPADPEEVADVIAYLASTDASYVTGEVVRVDGGLLA